MSELNISAVKKFSLAVSAAKRNGKFTRVGSEFIAELEGEVEAIIRDLRNTRFPVPAEDQLTPENANFVTGAMVEKLREALNNAVARIIQSKVQRQPSVGATLGRTR